MKLETAHQNLAALLECMPEVTTSFSDEDFVPGYAITHMMNCFAATPGGLVDRNVEALVELFVAMGPIHGARLARWAYSHLTDRSASWVLVSGRVEEHFAALAAAALEAENAELALV